MLLMIHSRRHDSRQRCLHRLLLPPLLFLFVLGFPLFMRKVAELTVVAIIAASLREEAAAFASPVPVHRRTHRRNRCRLGVHWATPLVVRRFAIIAGGSAGYL